MITASPVLFDALVKVPLLAGTTFAARTVIAQEGKVHDYTAGDWIVREGDEGHAFFILVEGEVAVIKRAGTATEVTICTLQQGEFFGEFCILSPTKRAASIRALQDARAIEIKASTLHHLHLQMPDQYAIVLLNLARDLARRLAHLDEAFAARAV
jgi:CRP-like cAMP-binding protein